MGITLNLNTTKKTLEGKYEFTFKKYIIRNSKW